MKREHLRSSTGIGLQRGNPTGESKRGFALMSAVSVLTIISALVLAYLFVAVDSSEWTTHEDTEHRLESAAESAITVAVDRLWGQFERQNVDQRTTPWGFRVFLDDQGIADSADGPPRRLDVLASSNLPTNGYGDRVVNGLIVEGLDVWRVDSNLRTQVFFEVTINTGENADGTRSLGSRSMSIQEAYVVERGDWEGLDYALLANNINCLMCHTEIDNVQRLYNQDDGRYGQYQRVKVGSLESFHLRSAPESWLAGTLYVGGSAVDASGNFISDWSGTSFKSRLFDGGGYLAQDLWGAMTETNLVAADPVTPVAGENLYLDYRGVDMQVDGYLPEEFPAPFPDDGGIDPVTGVPVLGNAGNRQVDASEFFPVAASSNGSVSGGTISVLDLATDISTDAQLDAFTDGTGATLGGTTEGNVYLYGTEADPILLNGDIAIRGDVIMHGVVKGTGSLMVSGNVYMPGDLIYADGTDTFDQRTYGTADDGTKNAFAIAAGQNIMLGDIFTSAWGGAEPVTGGTDGNFNFIIEELSLFNQMEWLKTQPNLPGQTVSTVVGTEEVEKRRYEREEYETTVPVYEYVDTGRPAEYGGPERVQVGTETVTRTRWVPIEPPEYYTVTRDIVEYITPDLANPHYIEDYVPRYYLFTNGSDAPIYNKGGYLDPVTGLWMAREMVGDWDSNKLSYADPSDSNDPFFFDSDGNRIAAISRLTAADWLSDELLEQLMKDLLAGRDDAEPFSVDATLYSNNSIFGIFPDRADEGNGELTVNGGIVAADVGILAPVKARINYDSRGKELLNITNNNRVLIKKQLSRRVHN